MDLTKTVCLSRLNFSLSGVQSQSTITYLGTRFSYNGSWEAEIDNRILQGRAAYARTASVLRSGIPLHQRLLFYKAIVRTTLTYQCGLWAPTVAFTHKLDRADRHLSRCLLRGWV